MAGRPHTERAPDDGPMVVEFLRGRDVACPLCGYNLRDLSEPRCPECRKELALAVGLRELRLGWFLVAVAPGLFSGIAAGLLLVVIIVALATEGGPLPWPFLAVEAFGWLSGLGALALIWHRLAFLRQPARRQMVWALLIWAVHVWAFVMFVLLNIWNV